MQLEKTRFEETVGSMSEQLMDFVEKMNKLERECVSGHHCTVTDLGQSSRMRPSLFGETYKAY